MFCGNCGKEIGDQLKFCTYCGAPTGQNSPAMDPAAGGMAQGGAGMKKKRRIWIPVLLGTILSLALVAVIGLTVYSRTPGQRVKKQLSLGERYLSDLDYEEAVAAFEEAIEIDPKNAEAYKGLAKAYVGIGDYEAAMEALQEGYEQTEKKALLRTETELCLEYAQELEDDGEIDKALRILEEQYEATGDERLSDRREEIEQMLELEREEVEEEERRKDEEEREAREEEDPDLQVAREVSDNEEECRKRHDELIREVGEGYSTGQVLPDFIFYDKNGNVVHSTDFLGKSVYINFFTTWCPYCFYEIPDMQKISGEYDEDEAVVIMIDLQETVAEAEAYAQEYGITMPIYYYDDWAMGDYQITGVPVSVVIDRYGRLVDAHEGMAEYAWMSQAMAAAVKNK